MKRSLFVLLALGIIAGLVFILGCSDDDEGTTPTTKQTGDPNDPVLDGVMMAFGTADEYNGDMLSDIMGLLGMVFEHPDHPAPIKVNSASFATETQADTFYLTYHSDSKYWYAYLQLVDTQYVSDTVWSENILTAEDSAQFLHGSTPVQWPDSALLTGINCGASISLEVGDQTASAEAHQIISIAGDIPGWGDVTINGNGSIAAAMTLGQVGSSCEFSVNTSSNFSNIVLNLAAIEFEACPSSGTATYLGSASIACTGDTSFTYSDYWSVVQTFANDSMHVVAENSTTRWEFTEACGPMLARSGFSIVRD
jgi:hypothetical protein